MGLGKEKDTFELPEIHSVFVGLKKTKTRDNRRFRYLGKYIAKRVEPLSAQEWKTLAIHVSPDSLAFWRIFIYTLSG